MDCAVVQRINKKYFLRTLTDEEIKFIYLLGVYYIYIARYRKTVLKKYYNNAGDFTLVDEDDALAKQPAKGLTKERDAEQLHEITSNYELYQLLLNFFYVENSLKKWEMKILNTVYFTNFLMKGNLVDVFYIDKTLKKASSLSCGWHIAFNEKLLGNCASTLYYKKDILEKPHIYTYNGPYTAGGVLAHLNYNKSIWIFKKAIENWVNCNQPTISGQFANPQRLINILNALNCQELSVAPELLKLINKMFSEKLPNTFLNLKKSPDFGQMLFALKHLNIYAEKHFFVKYILDNRCRCYVENILINYQLSKLCRACVKTTTRGTEHALLILKKLKVQISVECKKLTNDWTLLKDFFTLIKKKKCANTAANIIIGAYVPDVEYFLMYNIVDAMLKLGRICKKQPLLQVAISIIEEIYTSGLDFHLEKFETDKAKFDYISIVHSFWIWLSNENDLKLFLYNDASCSAIQLLALKTFCKNKQTLRLVNLWDNDSSACYDIYEFIQHKLKNLLPEYQIFISRNLVKARIMPGVYGQKLLTFIKLADDIILNDLWNKKPINEKVQILKQIDQHIWSTLRELDLDIATYLALCKQTINKENTFEWFNLLQIPIQIKRELKCNRTELLKQLKHEIKNKNTDKIKKINAKLAKDEKNYIRKHIKFTTNPQLKHNYIKLRLEKPTNLLDTVNLANNIAASSNHADDASILLLTSEKLTQLEIPHTVIHDSIGADISYNLIIKNLYKQSVVDYLIWLLDDIRFPFSILDKNAPFMQKYNEDRQFYKQNLLHIKKEILNSRRLFN